MVILSIVAADERREKRSSHDRKQNRKRKKLQQDILSNQTLDGRLPSAKPDLSRFPNTHSEAEPINGCHRWWGQNPHTKTVCGSARANFSELLGTSQSKQAVNQNWCHCAVRGSLGTEQHVPPQPCVWSIPRTPEGLFTQVSTMLSRQGNFSQQQVANSEKSG